MPSQKLKLENVWYLKMKTKEKKQIAKNIDMSGWVSPTVTNVYKTIHLSTKASRILIITLRELRTGYSKETNIPSEDKKRIITYIYNIERKLTLNKFLDLAIEEYQLLYLFFSQNIKQLDLMIEFRKKKIYKLSRLKYFSFSLKGFFNNIGVFCSKFFIGNFHYMFKLFLERRRKKLSHLLSIITK